MTETATDADGDGTASGGSAPVDDATEASDDEAYSSALGAFPYALRATRSWLCKGYVVFGGLFALFGTVVFLSALVGLLGALSSASAGTLTFQPALYLLLWLGVLAPVVGPILLVARRHRHGTDDRGYDFLLAATGFLFTASLYVAAVVSTPEAQQETVQPGAFAPLVRFLYDLPQVAGVVPPVLAAAVMVAVHYARR